MIFKQHYSGSLGNLYTITNAQGQRLIIDPGVSWGDVLKALDYDLTDVVGCLVTHEHGDHSKSAEKVIEYGIDVWMSAGTRDAIKFRNDLNRKSVYILESSVVETGIGNFSVLPFNTVHDAQEPFGFVISCNDEYLLFATDTSNITQKFEHKFSIIAIECSYDAIILLDMIERQTINETLAKRLLTSHMEKENAKRYLREFCEMSQCRELHLLHMSGDNINHEKTRQEFEDEFFVSTVICAE